MKSNTENAIQKIGLPVGRRPKGITPKQWRLAAIYPRAATAYEALIAAGYSANTAAKQSSNILDLRGTKRAFEVQQRQQADRARGLLSVGSAALATVTDDLKELEARDRIAVGLQATKLAHELGESVEQQGSGGAWKQRIRRACILMARLTEQRLQRAVPPTPAAPLLEDGSIEATIVSDDTAAAAPAAAATDEDRA